jgi:hypothetical protein
VGGVGGVDVLMGDARCIGGDFNVTFFHNERSGGI